MAGGSWCALVGNTANVVQGNGREEVKQGLGGL